MKHWYVVLTPEFTQENNGKQFGVNVFMSVQTKDGRWVTSSNALNEFPELFENVEELQTVQLSEDNFDIPNVE